MTKRTIRPLRHRSRPSKVDRTLGCWRANAVEFAPGLGYDAGGNDGWLVVGMMSRVAPSIAPPMKRMEAEIIGKGVRRKVKKPDELGRRPTSGHRSSIGRAPLS